MFFVSTSSQTGSLAHPIFYPMGIGSKAAVAWSLSLSSDWCRGQEYVDLNIHSPIRLHCSTLDVYKEVPCCSGPEHCRSPTPGTSWYQRSWIKGRVEHRIRDLLPLLGRADDKSKRTVFINGAVGGHRKLLVKGI
jgi:hypothetical protein